MILRRQLWRRVALLLLLVVGTSNLAHAASVQSLADTNWWDQLLRFLSFRDAALRYALAGSILLGLSCGLLGSFIVVRRMALVGDALSHAVLPGVALGFLWGMTKDPLAIFVGAVVAGLAGTALVTALTRTTRLKEDTALGLVLASFFAAGICLVTMIQRLPTGNKSGLDKFLFGQAAALGADDITLMAVVTTVAVVLVTLFYKELLATSFDEGFARSSGIPSAWVHHGLMLVLAAATVIALQAVGVVLVSAMLITPAATAYLLTDRLHRMLLLASGFGILAGAAGAFFSFIGRGLPTGPLMVIGASTVFAGAYFLAPRHGVVARWWRHRQSAARTSRENTLKALYHVWEDDGFRDVGVTLSALAERRRETIEEALSRSGNLMRHGLATVDRDVVYFTPEGRQRAAEIVRNHRLWELYLTNSANIAPDHVHEDAEKIEHVLGETVVRELERRLNYATVDPHGKAIPGPRDIHFDAATRAGGEKTNTGGTRE
ncbi:metal ABC transporter permease [Synoicihabitans lomoniglobus]|uniref:Metal ABC transporter permease n=1 Tax=Synoicihabitans lomoniglobus TaxID=2909285 RepID=A0AAF0CS99_9BACT|nr:metal ABC transporter permease [Opitutaceae bacterium LMO-M01]WED67164.1 metal ABC transporter permease [Opitutaceae bacterium LMO-M01]